MSRMLRADGWKSAYPLAGLLLLGLATSACAEHKPLTKEEQDKVEKAIDKGVAYLKRAQSREGYWLLTQRSNFRLGQTLLIAYALMESGVPAKDPAIQKAADFIRPRLPRASDTYDIALALLFLDRLGDPKDKPLIRSLALRLIAGQHPTGGWNYRCPTMSKEREDALFKALAEFEERQDAGETSRANLIKGLPRWVTALAAFRDPRDLPWQDPPPSEGKKDNGQTLFMGTTDNSNTQFAVLGLWAAQRHAVPVRPVYRLTVERFERSQQGNGWWSYAFVEAPSEEAVKHPSMICVGLLGLAVGRGLKLPTPGSSRTEAVDLRILKGLAALSQDIGAAAAGLERAASSRGVYYLWSVERVSMIYDLPTIGDKDWYRWGATMLLLGQRPNGSWLEVLVSDKDLGRQWGPGIHTAFALLFLKRSHPMKELTSKLPYTAKELNQGIARLLGGAAPREPAVTAPSRGEKPRR